MTTAKKYKTALVEPSPIVLAGIRSLLASCDDFDIFLTAPDVRTFISSPKASSCDRILINPAVADRHGRTSLKGLISQGRDIPVAAIAYVYAPAAEMEQYDTVIDIIDDKPAIIKKLHRCFRDRNSVIEKYGHDNAELSPREKEILACLANGHTNKEIAERNNISVHTVISHRKNISRKTGIKTVSGLTVYALLNNLIDRPETE